MEVPKQRNGCPTSPSLKLSNGYILPEGKMTPNTLFVGGIDMKVDETEIRDFFARFGAVKEVKIITYRGGICKGYGFVYFSEDVDIQTIVEPTMLGANHVAMISDRCSFVKLSLQQVSFKGRKLKLGPAIMKERSPRSIPPHLIGPTPWINPSQYIYCTCCPPMGGGVAPLSPVLNSSSPYIQGYSYSGVPGVVFPQIPMNYSQAAYATAYACQYAAPHWTGEQRTPLVNQTFVDSGVQTLLTLL